MQIADKEDVITTGTLSIKSGVGYSGSMSYAIKGKIQLIDILINFTSTSGSFAEVATGLPTAYNAPKCQPCYGKDNWLSFETNGTVKLANAASTSNNFTFRGQVVRFLV